MQHNPGGVLLLQVHADSDLSAVSELDCVPQEIYEDLPEAHGITFNHTRHLVGNLYS
jgi:hypothetical protein